MALGSGAARGCAHFGVIAALKEAGIPIHCIAGTSAGALAGASLACGTLDAFEKRVRSLTLKDVLFFFSELPLNRQGLIEGRRVMDFVREFIPVERIEDLSIPFRCIATGLQTGEPMVFDSGNVLDAVRASISIPGLFVPVQRKDKWLIDGAMCNPVPVDQVREMGADFVIAVDVNQPHSNPALPSPAVSAAEKSDEEKTTPVPFTPIKTKLQALFSQIEFPPWNHNTEQNSSNHQPLNMIEVSLVALHLMEARLSRLQLTLHPPDLLIEPHAFDINVFEFYRASEIIERGHAIAQQSLSSFPALHPDHD